MNRHMIEFTTWDWKVLTHPPDCYREHCPAETQAEAMRLPDGRMQVQGVYRESESGKSYERWP